MSLVNIKMKEVILSEAGTYLVDSDGIKFKRPKPLSTIEVKVSTVNPPNTRIDTKVDFVDAIENFPDVNAYLNLGPILGKSKTEQFEPEDPEMGTVTTRYWFYEVELYHLGE